MLGHPPEIAVEGIVEAGAHAAERRAQADRGAPPLAHDELEAAVRMDAQQLGRGGADVVRAVQAAALDARPDVEGAAERARLTAISLRLPR